MSYSLLSNKPSQNLVSTRWFFCWSVLASLSFVGIWRLGLESWRLTWAGTSKMHLHLTCLVPWYFPVWLFSLCGGLFSRAFACDLSLQQGSWSFYLGVHIQEHKFKLSVLYLRTVLSLLAHSIGKVSYGTSLDSLWEGGTYRCRYRETRSIEGHFVDQLTQKGGENTPEKDDPLQRSSARPDRRESPQRGIDKIQEIWPFYFAIFGGYLFFQDALDF